MHKLFWLLLPLLVSCQTSNQDSVAQPPFPSLGPLVERVAQSRQAQVAAVQQFHTAGEQLSQWANGSDGEWSAISTAVATEHDNAVQAAVAMSGSIDAVEQTADALFQQWQIEIDVLTDASLKTENQTKMAQSWQSYQNLIQVLHQSESQVDTVLAALNARAVALQGTTGATALAAQKNGLGVLSSNITALVQQLNSSIASSDAFITSSQQ